MARRIWNLPAEACKLLVVVCENQFPAHRLNPGPLHQERGVLATGPAGKSPKQTFSYLFLAVLGLHLLLRRFPRAPVVEESGATL